MPYIVPKVRVFQEFQLLPTAITEPLRAFVAGPQAALHRYSVASEKSAISVGEYDSGVDTPYAWPDKDTGSVVDFTYTKLFVDDALLRYFEDAVGVDSLIAPVSGKSNRIRSTTVVWKTANSVVRAASLLDRDVAVGDRVLVRAVGSDAETHTLNTYVKSFAAEQVAASIDSAYPADTNLDTQSAATAIDKISGADNNIEISADGSNYDGLVDGDAVENYTVEVTIGSTGEDLTTARLRVTSASGRDNDDDVAPSESGLPTTIGTRGLTVTWTLNENSSGSSLAVEDGAAPNDFVTGQKWRVYVRQAFTAPVAASDGTYTGAQDTTYIVEVTKGGIWADDPEITISSTTGYDFSGPTVVTDAATDTPVGSYGVLVTFTQSSLRKGDKYYIPVESVSNGAVKTLILGHNLPDELLEVDDLHVELYIRKNIQVTANRIDFAPLENWEQSATEFTVQSGITVYDPTWTDDGVEVALDVVGGELYIEYREWLTTFVGTIESLSDPADVEANLGTIHPDNPLAYGVFKALSNSNGTDVYFSSVSDPTDADAWAEVVTQVADGSDDIYNMVPLTFEKAYQDLFVAHADSQSGPEKGRWRACFLGLQASETEVLVGATTSSDEAVVLARLVDDGSTSGTQYTLLEVTSGNAELEELGVRPGDVVRFLYSTDGFGNASYSSFVVEEVRSETSLVLETGHSVAVNVAQKIEIWRNLSKAAIATNVARAAGSFGNRRVCAVWPDTIKSGGLNVAGYYLCAALAGLRSGVVPHQPLTNVEITGFDSVDRTSKLFSASNLDTLAESGVWIVTQDRLGNIFTRHALTTDVTDLNHQEEVIRVNVDSMSFIFLNQMKPFIGRSNVTDAMLRQIRTTLGATMEFLKARGFTESLGAQLIDGSVETVSVSAIQADRVTATLRLTIPRPLNHLDVFLVI